MTQIQGHFNFEAPIIEQKIFSTGQVANWLARFKANDLFELLTNEINSEHGHREIEQAHKKFKKFPTPQYPTQEQLYQPLNTNNISSHADGILRRRDTYLKTAIETKDPQKIYQVTINIKAAADSIVKKASPREQQHQYWHRKRQLALHKERTWKQRIER